MTISGQVVEGLVVDEVKRLLAGIRESASAADGVSEASAALESAQEQLDAAIRAFAALGSEPAAVERLSELQAARDAAREDLDGKLADRDATTVAVDVGDWDEASTRRPPRPHPRGYPADRGRPRLRPRARLDRARAGRSSHRRSHPVTSSSQTAAPRLETPRPAGVGLQAAIVPT